MIELPPFARIGSVSPALIDMGFTQRGISTSERINRKGSRYRAACSFGPYPGDQARQMVARLIRGKQEGLRIALPLLHSQGSPGVPLVDGAVSTGRSLAIKGLSPGYFCKEGFWLSIVVSGQHFLHNVYTGGRADASGNLTLTLNEMIRTSIPDEAVIHLAKPMIEGLVDGDEWQWSYAVDRVVPIEFAIEEKQ